MVNMKHREVRPNLISVVIPAFNEEGNLRVVYSALCNVLEGYDWEVVFVDDGSKDKTYSIILELNAEDPRVRGLSFSRNFGHQYALLAGMRAAKGDVIISMDADLQHPPELLPKMIKAWQDGYNIVHTERYYAPDTRFFKRVTSNAFYRVFSLLSGLKLEIGQSDFRLLDRRALNVIVQHDSGQLFLRGIVRAVGFRSTSLPYNVGERFSGDSKYTFRRMLRFAMQGITSFSTVPLRLGILCGFAMGGLAFLELCYILWVATQGTAVPGWTSIAALISILFGVNFLLIGFLGIYIGHIFARVQHQPVYIIESSTEDPQRGRLMQVAAKTSEPVDA
jgi:polyisoprenyl-phosphate glycosyltransferase